jgi:hypothetical protein
MSAFIPITFILAALITVGATLSMSRRRAPAGAGAPGRAAGGPSSPWIGSIMTWQATYVPLVAGVIAAGAVWLLRDGSVWAALVAPPIIYAVASTYISAAFVRGRVPATTYAVAAGIAVGGLSAVAAAAWQ